MNTRTAARHLAAPLVIFGILAAATVAAQPATVDQAPHIHPEIAAVPQTMLIEQATAGRTCDETPVLTDHIIVTDANGVTTEVTFDQALAASKTGSTVRLYCH